MKALTTAALAILALATTATAGDLPSKKTPPAPPAPVESAYPATWYVGVSGGGNVAMDRSLTDTPGVFGALVGREINKDVRVEATVDNYFAKGSDKSNVRGTVNAVYGPISMIGITPYLLAGAGAKTNAISDGIDGVKGIYNVGAGVRYGITKNWEADARYRWVNTWSNKDKDTNVVTLGVNYKF
jgi:opacity protein-like surface antigen